MTILIIGLLLVAYSFLTKKKYNPYIGFLFPLLIMGFQSGVQGDYQSYMADFSFGGAGSTTKVTEFAWLAMNELFQPLGFPAMVFFMSLVECSICAYFVKHYVTKDKQWLGAILFFFSVSCMLIQMKAMRQGMAMEFALLSFMFTEKRKFIPAVITASLSFGFHNSAIVILCIWVIYFISKLGTSYHIPVISKMLHKYENKSIGSWFAIGCVVACFAIYLLKQTIVDVYLMPLAMSNDNFDYSGYLDEMGSNKLALWLMVSFSIKAYVFALLIAKNKKYRIFSFLVLMSIFVNMMFFGFGNLMRIANYYTLFTIAVVPIVCSFMEQNFKKGKTYSMLFLLMYFVIELRTTLPWLLGNGDDSFETYRFIFFD